SDNPADARDIFDDVDDLVRPGHGIANEWSVNRDRGKDEEHDQRDSHVACPQIEEQPKATHDLDSVDRGQNKRRGWKTDRGQDSRGLSKGKNFPQTRRDKEERDQATRKSGHVDTFAFRALICAVLRWLAPTPVRPRRRPRVRTGS